jgi:excinuclease ABC subunit A
VVDRLAVPDETNRGGERVIPLAPHRLGGDGAGAGRGLLILAREGRDDVLLSEQNSCPDCDISFPELSPAMFSFNSPLGMCPTCNGLGTQLDFTPERFIDPDKSVLEGAVKVWGRLAGKKSSGTYKYVQQILGQFGHEIDTPWRELSETCRHTILYGGAEIIWRWENERGHGEHQHKTEGIIPNTRRLYHQTQSEERRRYWAPL